MKSTARIASHPIHPMLIPFPLGLWSTSFILNVLGALFDSFALHQAAYYMVLAGCIGAALAAIPGAIDLFSSIPAKTETRRIGVMHGALNVAALVIWIVSLYARQGGGGMTYMAYITAAIGMIILGVSGWLGGELVYKHQVGVEEGPVARA
jgi:uncharacterized membrane protein